MAPEPERSDILTQLHIDAARNSTDDFNPFHDPYKWQRIRGNPFPGPIALGFQLEALAAHRLHLFRQHNGEQALIESHGLRFANYQLNFVDILAPGDSVQIEVRKTRKDLEAENGMLSNRLLVRKGKRPVVVGYQRESQKPLALGDVELPDFGDLSSLQDRSWLMGDAIFMKRKYMNNSNAKNFLVGSMVDQHYYFDELEDRVRYPLIFPVALLSCALLEKAHTEGYDFYQAPMVYTHHDISIDRVLVDRLRSNDRLHLLVQGPEPITAEGGLGKSRIPQVRYRCYGLLADNETLFRALVSMARLEDVVATLRV
ncbi:MAG: MaoC family dehydratase [Gammaproteobacteria bacterium]|nr:MaoC family dehydratase [Gammaproteobacteria bacterium]